MHKQAGSSAFSPHYLSNVYLNLIDVSIGCQHPARPSVLNVLHVTIHVSLPVLGHGIQHCDVFLLDLV